MLVQVQVQVLVLVLVRGHEEGSWKGWEQPGQEARQEPQRQERAPVQAQAQAQARARARERARAQSVPLVVYLVLPQKTWSWLPARRLLAVCSGTATRFR